ncbi:MAG: class I SAM-dependent RNA methyltransferase [Kiritimatiellia bacterium]|jgi:tRNA/tmRNA/rRNA uracil-C5-methylase (TrmA/RlmC/RlmD family)|nr:class I SAM-dependent RNA methyltransferase [Kiritimatiellia bacterium]MDP6629913.1 class I SAM-dependent RNA methyltransferase [Kiritimatiellia bacterium]MDP6810111.1 class I SAM-dependent RNA methyltransferase [Kiritimatiellia bacterium]MDP7023670.1 class I SAM-dependent RNA methyltransferase [Kiritimatiellia bacterium]
MTKKKTDTETLELTIQDVGYRGRGVGRDANQVVFVPGVIEGERVRVRVTHRHKRFADAQLLEVLDPSPQRIAPACPLALRASSEEGAPAYPCVGCAYQHMAYEEEVRMKQRQLESLLKRMAKLDEVPFSEPVGSPLALGYRNKIRLHGGTYQGKRVLGYVGANNHSVLDVPRCLLAHETINARLAELRGDVPSSSLSQEQRSANPMAPPAGPTDSQNIPPSSSPPSLRASVVQTPPSSFLQSLRRSAEVTFRWTEADGVLESIRGVKRMSGELTEHSVLGDLTVPAGGFYQINPGVADLVVEYVRGHLGGSDCGHVLDLYCGVGVFGLAAGLAGKRVWGVDSDGRAIACAAKNVEQMLGGGDATEGPERDVVFEEGRVEYAVKEMLDTAPLDDTLAIVDPPRTGLDRRVVEALTANAPRELVYVSCAPDTLARDLVPLVASGYRVKEVKLFDMFPRTACFETVVVMGRE